MSFIAQYPGGCAECGGQVKDTEVVYNAEGQLEHKRCPDAVDDVGLRPGEKPCTTCWQVHAGECP